MKITKIQIFLGVVVLFLVLQVLRPPVEVVQVSPETGVAGTSLKVYFKSKTFLESLAKVELVEMDNPYRAESSFGMGDGSKRKANGSNGPKVKLADFVNGEASIVLNEAIPQTKFYQVRAKYFWNIWYNYNGVDLRVAMLDRAEVIPPDPGEKGKETLLGIDTDGNGLRDDLDREITFDTPFSWKAREAYKRSEIAYYKTWDPNLSKSEKEKLAHEETILLDCLNKNVGDWYFKHNLRGNLNFASISLNTNDRQQMFEKSMFNGGPRTMEEYLNPCPPDLAP